MPYKSKAQAAFIHIKANEGESWAKKYVKEERGSHVEKAHDDIHRAMKSIHGKKKEKDNGR